MWYRMDNTKDIMKSCFHNEEYEAVQEADIKKKQEIFYKIWTRKEAYCKYTGTGLCHDVKKYNTIEVHRASYFHTWKFENYMCSVYSGNVNFSEMEIISYKDLWEYYKNIF